MERLENADPDAKARMIQRVDRAAAYAQIDRELNLAWFNGLDSNMKTQEPLLVYLLRRLLDK